MADYAQTAFSASQSIQEAGAPIVLTRPGEGDYDTATSEVDAGENKYPGFGLRTEYDNRHIDGTSILAGDVKILLAVHQRIDDRLNLGAQLPEPKAGDLIELGGEVWRVIRPKILKPALTAVLYEVQARK